MAGVYGRFERADDRDDVIGKTKLQSWFAISCCPTLRIKDALKPFHGNLGVSVPGIGAGVMPSRCGANRPVTPMSRSRPYIHIPTVAADAFNRGHGRPLDTGASIVTRIVLPHKNLDRAEHREPCCRCFPPELVDLASPSQSLRTSTRSSCSYSSHGGSNPTPSLSLLETRDGAFLAPWPGSYQAA